MKITINGQEKEIPQPRSLSEVIKQFNKDNRRVVAEVNGTIIHFNQWDSVSLNTGDSVELVSFVGGG